MKKDEVAQKLNQVLMVQGIHWELLPEEDLERLVSAFSRLKSEVEEVFSVLDEVLDQPLTVVENKGEWKNYVV